MLKRIIGKIKNLFLAIPFGMKAADELLATSNKDDDAGSSMHQKISQNNLLNDLLKGEITQEVEELTKELEKDRQALERSSSKEEDQNN